MSLAPAWTSTADRSWGDRLLAERTLAITDLVNFGETARTAVVQLLQDTGLDPGIASRRPIRFVGSEPNYATRHKIVLAAAVALGAQASAAEAWGRYNQGRGQDIEIDVLQAAAGLCTVHYQRQHGYSMPSRPGAELKGGFYGTADGRWFYPIGPYPHLRNGILDMLECANSELALARAIAKVPGAKLEELFAARKLPGVFVRTRNEWLSHDQGKHLSATPVIAVEKIGDAQGSGPTTPPGPQSLSGLRVLDVSHVIAGPIAARTLAEQGAQVLRISAPHQSDPTQQIMDTSIGKRSAFLDLELGRDVERLRQLCTTADVFVQSWRPGGMDRRGFSPNDVAAIRPGIVYVSVSAYGLEGPWAPRGGFDQVGQVVSGISHDEGIGGRPRLVPTFLLNDYLTGYLAATGAVIGLLLRATQGGSYHVSVSLTRTSMWVQDFGKVNRPATTIDPADLRPKLERRDSPFGLLDQVPPIAQFSLTPSRWELPPSPLGAHTPEWAE